MDNSAKNRNQYIDLIKLFACLFITNSHCPYNNALLKIGGGWGNAIFFIVAGYLISGIQSAFIPWIKKRCMRVLPLTIIMTILAAFVYGVSKHNFYYHATRFWFVIAIVIYYIFFYAVDVTKQGYVIVFILHIVGYIALYIVNYKNELFIELGGLSFFKVYF